MQSSLKMMVSTKEVEYTPAKLEDLSRDEIRERIKAAGVVGMGGARLPDKCQADTEES